jgi:uncharacterized protein YjiS (DUF1127 family)
MSTMNLSLSTFRLHQVSRWSQLKNHFAEWRRRARSRGELMSLSDGSLQDIGVCRGDAQLEASKPFWMA